MLLDTDTGIWFALTIEYLSRISFCGTHLFSFRSWVVLRRMGGYFLFEESRRVTTEQALLHPHEQMLLYY